MSLGPPDQHKRSSTKVFSEYGFAAGAGGAFCSVGGR